MDVDQQIPELLKRQIYVFGMGYVGLTLAVALADAGLNVTGVEIKREVVDDLQKGVPHFFEKGLHERLSSVISSGQLKVKNTFRRLNQDKGIFIITVGTPLDLVGNPRLDMITQVSEEIGQSLVDDDLVILRSTVRLGTSNDVVRPILNKSCKRFLLSFCPERTLEGNALNELQTNPQIIGGIDEMSVSFSAMLFQKLTPNLVRVSNIKTAEMIKLVDNAARDAKFAYSNEIAKACDYFGISAAEVINSGKLGYPRTDLALPGPVGGPCLEKDPYIFADGLKQYGFNPKITIESRLLNESMPQHALDLINYWQKEVAGNKSVKKVVLLGLAFKGKPSTNDTRGSVGLKFGELVKKANPQANLFGFDETIDDAEMIRLGYIPTKSLVDAFDSADLVVIMNNHAAFENMALETLSEQMSKPALIYDFWNNYRAEKLSLSAATAYVALGSHNALKG